MDAHEAAQFIVTGLAEELRAQLMDLPVLHTANELVTTWSTTRTPGAADGPLAAG